jgi:hypothetical protein
MLTLQMYCGLHFQFSGAHYHSCNTLSCIFLNSLYTINIFGLINSFYDITSTAKLKKKNGKCQKNDTFFFNFCHSLKMTFRNKLELFDGMSVYKQIIRQFSKLFDRSGQVK